MLMHRNDQKQFIYIDSIWKKIVSLILTLNSLTYKHTFHIILNIMKYLKANYLWKMQTESMFYTYNM